MIFSRACPALTNLERLRREHPWDGADAAPYFRIFNPTTQSRRFDPEAEFIARWLPELAGLPAKSRHQPNAEQRRQTGYPPAIVDHGRARARALEAFKNLG